MGNFPNFVFVTARCPGPTINRMYLASRLGIQTCGACAFLFVSPAAALGSVILTLRGPHHQLVIIGHYGLLGPRLDTHLFELPPSPFSQYYLAQGEKVVDCILVCIFSS